MSNGALQQLLEECEEERQKEALREEEERKANEDDGTVWGWGYGRMGYVVWMRCIMRTHK